MLPTFSVLRAELKQIISDKDEQGHVTDGLMAQLDALANSYDALMTFAAQLAHLPLRPNWQYVEPNDLDEIWAECDPKRPIGTIGSVELADSARRVEAAFLASVCGCILGKPLESRFTFDEIAGALKAIDEYPLQDYVSERMLPALGRRHDSWTETVRERIAYVARDDDINYTILGMLILEQHGIHFSKANLRDLWLQQLPIRTSFGPERTILIKAGLDSLDGGGDGDPSQWATALNPRDEYCGALIRADAYGYACPGRPALAAELSWRDASFTHRRTGIYATMFVAAAIATAQVMRDRLGIFEMALRFVPQRSRFYKVASDSLADVRQARDWIDGYRRIHDKYKAFGHCRIFQEIGTLMNTLRFAENVGDGICIQVSQGNDTDSFGATAGSLLGAFFGPGFLDDRWLRPFHDDIRTALAWFDARSLSMLARRMGELPKRVAAEIEGNEKTKFAGVSSQ